MRSCPAVLHAIFVAALLLLLQPGQVLAGEAAPLPSPWLAQDIGSPAVAGSASYSAPAFTIVGAGTDIWGAQDQFHFVYQPLAGDGTIQARIDAQQGTDTWAKTGVMMRSSLDAAAPFVAAEMLPTLGSIAQYRTVDGVCGHATGIRWATSPFWVKLVRAGLSVTAFSAPDNYQAPGAWSQIGDAQSLGSGTIYVGLAVTSHNASVPCTSVISRVHVAVGSTNAAPTVATVAAAPAVVGRTAQATVRGADDGGEAALTYTWSAAWSSSGPVEGALTATNNGTNAAKKSKITFARPGAYILRATLTDAAGSSTSSDVPVTVIPGSSPVSPACVEGVERLTPGSGAVAANVQGVAVPLHIISDTRYYGDVPLSASGPTTCAFNSSASSSTGSITWTPTLLKGDASITLRPHDALLLKARVAGTVHVLQDCGPYQPDQSVAAGAVIVQRFDEPGSYTVSASNAAGTQVSQISVTVVGVDFDGPVACQIGYGRTKEVAVLGASPDQLCLSDNGRTADGLQRLLVQRPATQPPLGIRLTVTPLLAGDLKLIARAGDAYGPIIALQPIDDFTLETTASYATGVIETYPDGSLLLGATMTMAPWVRDIDVQMHTIIGGVTFADSTTSMTWSTNAMTPDGTAGSYPYRIIVGPGVDARACHAFTAYQRGVQVSF